MGLCGPSHSHAGPWVNTTGPYPLTCPPLGERCRPITSPAFIQKCMVLLSYSKSKGLPVWESGNQEIRCEGYVLCSHLNSNYQVIWYRELPRLGGVIPCLPACLVSVVRPPFYLCITVTSSTTSAESNSYVTHICYSYKRFTPTKAYTSWPPQDLVFFLPALFVTRLLTPRSRKSGYGLLLGCRSGLNRGSFEKNFF